MKKFIFSLFAAAALVSCTQEDLSENAKNLDAFTPDFENIKPFEELKVAVPADSVAIVLYKGDTLAITNIDGTSVKVPNVASASLNETRTVSAPSWWNNVEIVYKNMSDDEIKAIQNEIGASVFARSFNRQTIMFEDTKQGDNDYNDFVFQVYQEKISPLDAVSEYGDLSVSFGIKTLIQPIALGSDKSTVIKLGVDVVYEEFGDILSKTYVVSEDVRKDAQLFGNYETKDGFINTTNRDKRFKEMEMPTISPMKGNINEFNETNFYFNWWIEVNGEKLYSIPETNLTRNNWHNKSGFPYGLVFSEVYSDNAKMSTVKSDNADKVNNNAKNWINYPKERVNIETVYPGFKNWLKGSDVVWSAPIEGTYFNALGEAQNLEAKTEVWEWKGFLPSKKTVAVPYVYYPNSLFLFSSEK